VSLLVDPFEAGQHEWSHQCGAAARSCRAVAGLRRLINYDEKLGNTTRTQMHN
jgi:hypothetical protein